MSIGTGDAIEKFGTQDTVSAGGGTSAVSDGAFSADTDATAWTNDDDAPEAAFVLTCQWSTATGVANKPVNLYARPLNINSTADAVQPQANRKATYLGTFIVYAASADTDYEFDLTARLPNHYSSQQYEFYIENRTGQSIDAGWTLKVTPKTLGPHA